MKLDYGTIIIIVAVLLFYLRLIVVQRQRTKQAQRQYALVRAKYSKKKETRDKKPEVYYDRIGVHIRNWWYVAGGIILITGGAVVKYLNITIANFDFWWIPITLGILLFGLGVG